MNEVSDEFSSNQHYMLDTLKEGNFLTLQTIRDNTEQIKVYVYMCTQYPTQSTSLKCAVALGLVMADEDLVLIPEFPPHKPKEKNTDRQIFLERKVSLGVIFTYFCSIDV